MTKSVQQLKEEWRARWPAVSGATVIEIFGPAARESWEGAEALIDAYSELLYYTGEGPSRKYITDHLYLAIKSYWSPELGDKLQKLDEFLTMLH